MSITRKGLKAMGLNDEQTDSILEGHLETVNSLKEQRDGYKADAERLAVVSAELETLKAKSGDGYKEKYEAEHSAFEKFKAELVAKETKQQKTDAVKKYFESKGIIGKNLDIAMRGVWAEIEGAELEGDKLKSTEALDSLISGDYSGLVGKVETRGVQVETPPASSGEMTKEEFLKLPLSKQMEFANEKPTEYAAMYK